MLTARAPEAQEVLAFSRSFSGGCPISSTSAVSGTTSTPAKDVSRVHAVLLNGEIRTRRWTPRSPLKQPVSVFAFDTKRRAFESGHIALDFILDAPP